MVFCKDKEPCRWRRRKEARPEEILDAALELFTEKGFAATRMNDVARQAGISKGTLYLYFESKEAIFKSVVHELISPQLEQVEKIVDSYGGSSADLLASLIRGWWETIGRTKLSAIPKLMISEAGNFPELAEFFVDNVVKRARRLYSRVISRGIVEGEFRAYDPEAAARLIIAPLVYITVYRHSLQMYDHSMDEDEYIEMHIEFALNSLLKNNDSNGAGKNDQQD
jgi:AcrR family transcriptional regulator